MATAVLDVDREAARTARRLRLERKLADLHHRAERYRRQAAVVGPFVGEAFERRAAELELQAVALQARFGDDCGLPLQGPVVLAHKHVHAA